MRKIDKWFKRFKPGRDKPHISFECGLWLVTYRCFGRSDYITIKQHHFSSAVFNAKYIWLHFYPGHSARVIDK